MAETQIDIPQKASVIIREHECEIIFASQSLTPPSRVETNDTYTCSLITTLGNQHGLQVRYINTDRAEHNCIFENILLSTQANLEPLHNQTMIQLGSIIEIANQVIQHPEIHRMRNTCIGRQTITFLANLRKKAFIIPPGSHLPQIVIIGLAALSTFTMADIPLSMFWLVMGMAGSGLFNLIGGVRYPGLEKPWNSDDSWCTAFKKFFTSASAGFSTAGLASAVSPAVLTYSGVKTLGYNTTLAICAAISNFLLSGTLGAVGISSVAPLIKDFYRGGYSPIVVREVELLIYSFLALVLTSARSYPTGDLVYAGKEWAKVLGAYGLSTILNIPETLMFISAFVGLRIKIHDYLSHKKFCPSLLGMVSMVLAILFAISFFLSFKGLTQQSWEARYADWFDAKGVTWLEQIMTYSGGLAASLLVVGEGETIESTIRYLGKFTYNLPQNTVNFARCIIKGLSCCRSSEVNDGEQTPMMPNFTPKVIVNEDDKPFNVYGSKSFKIDMENTAEDYKIRRAHEFRIKLQEENNPMFEPSSTKLNQAEFMV